MLRWVRTGPGGGGVTAFGQPPERVRERTQRPDPHLLNDQPEQSGRELRGECERPAGQAGRKAANASQEAGITRHTRGAPGSDRSALGFMTRLCAPGGRVGATHRYPGGRPAITSFQQLASSLRPALSLRRQGVEPRRPLPSAGRVRLLLHDIPAPPTMD